MIFNARIASDIFFVERFTSRMLSRDFGAVIPDRFRNFINQIFWLRSCSDHVHGTDIEPLEIAVETFVNASGNSCWMKESVFLDQCLSLVFIKRDKLDIKGTGCLRNGPGGHRTTQKCSIR